MRSSEPYSGESPRCQYCFGAFTLDLGGGFLRRGGEEVTLRPKPFEVLAYLVGRHGRLVTKTALMEAVWPDAAITDNSLAQCLVEIRRALDDDSQQLIRTVARRGYMFTAPVTTPVVQFPLQPAGAPAEPGPLLAPPGRPAPVRRTRLRWLVWAAAIVIAACLVAAASIHALRKTPPASIAVLPFVNLGSEKDSEYLSDGITEEITNTLARLPGLRVTARSSAFRFKGGRSDVRDVGRQLGASTVLEGSVRKTSGRLRITAQLVNTVDGYHLWSDAYDRDDSEILAIQASIAQAVANNLGLKPASHLNRHTRNPEAYNLVLKARYLGESDEKINCYRRALAHDPDYAAAYVGLADEWIRLAVQGTVPPTQVMEQSRDASRKALQLDDNLPDAHFVSATVKWIYEWDWAGAEREFVKALNLNPNSATIRVQYARYLALMGRRREALNQLDEIRVLDPISGPLRAIEAAVYYLTGDYDRTIEHARTVLAGEPALRLMYYWMGRAYESKGQMPEAISALEKSWHGSPESLQGRGFGMLASLYARVGRKADAMRLLESAIANSKRTYVSSCSVAIVYIGLGNPDRAMEWLEKAYEERDHSLVTLKTEPAYDPLRRNPKFVALLRRMKLE